MDRDGVGKVNSNAQPPIGEAAWVRRRPHRAAALMRDLEVHQFELECQNRQLREAQAELEESRRRYADLYDLAPVAYVTLDRQGCIRGGNLTATRLLRTSRETLLGLPLATLVERSDHGRLFEHLRRCFETRTEAATEMTLSGKRPMPLAVQVTSAPIFDGDKEVVECRTTLTDVSALRRGHDRLTLLSETSWLLCAAVDPRRHLRAVTRLTIDRFADVALLDLVAEDGTLKRTEQAGRSGTLAPSPKVSSWGSSFQREVLRSRQSIFVSNCRGREMEAAALDLAPMAGGTVSSWMMVPLLSRGAAIGVLTVAAAGRIGRFVADDLRTAEDLAARIGVVLDNARLHEQARNALAARDEMLACVAHDLRNPVHTIMLSTNGVSDAPPGIERRKGWPELQRVRRSAEQISRMIGDLTEVSRLDAGTFDLALGPRDVRSLLSEAFESLLPLAQEKKVALRIELPVEAHMVLCDRERVFQVLANLIGNAVKFTPPGGAIDISSKSSERMVVLTVSDNGPGVPASDRGNIFAKYWQGDGAREGRGLGLYIAKRLVEAHGGSIWCESEAAKGTTMSLTLQRCGATTRVSPQGPLGSGSDAPCVAEPIDAATARQGG